MIELKWVGRKLYYRQRDFMVDATGSFCGQTGFGEWRMVEQRRQMPPFVKAAKEIIAAYQQHGIGPQFPELQAAIEQMESAFDDSVWSAYLEHIGKDEF